MWFNSISPSVFNWKAIHSSVILEIREYHRKSTLHLRSTTNGWNNTTQKSKLDFKSCRTETIQYIKSIKSKIFILLEKMVNVYLSIWNNWHNVQLLCKSFKCLVHSTGDTRPVQSLIQLKLFVSIDFYNWLMRYAAMQNFNHNPHNPNYSHTHTNTNKIPNNNSNDHTKKQNTHTLPKTNFLICEI